MNVTEEYSRSFQSIIFSSLILLFGLGLTYISYSVEDPGPYLFPRLISIGFVILAFYLFVKSFGGTMKAAAAFKARQFLKIIPILTIMVLHGFVLINALGFYLSGAITFFVLNVIYDQRPQHDWRSWGVRLCITACFIATLYLVFAMGLRVPTPRGLFL